ncbi:hypothetical protein TNCV_4260611 [Trichonephila clavipes]|nr:hypothetical protein TNCV_4260611 [Trichonephila clavipes]
MALSGSLPQINLGVQGVTQGAHHIIAHSINFAHWEKVVRCRCYGNKVEIVRNWLLSKKIAPNTCTCDKVPTDLACIRTRTFNSTTSRLRRSQRVLRHQ